MPQANIYPGDVLSALREPHSSQLQQPNPDLISVEIEAPRQLHYVRLPHGRDLKVVTGTGNVGFDVTVVTIVPLEDRRPDTHSE